MSKQSEEVLLIVNSVKNKKTDGVLYMMGERMAWMQSSKNSFTYSHAYTDIKSQKISPDTKEKVQLQIVMHDGSANTFQFSSGKGRSIQLADRDSIKELLQQLLPKFRQKISSELEEKNRLLQENPALFQLYKDLVVSQVIAAEEFWATQAPRFTSGEKAENKQTTGVSPAFLADIKPQNDGCNGLKYNLTADIIDSIFKTYPMVKKKHAEAVPHQMMESEFWTRFFQSHYFHRDRTALSTKDIFSECAKKDEEEIKVEVERKVENPLLDLTGLQDTSPGEGYRGSLDERQSSGNQTNLTMIRRFNHHSSMVLKACEAAHSSMSTDSSPNPSQPNGTPQANGDVNKTHSSTSVEEIPHKKARIREKLTYEDLVEEKKTTSINLRLSRMERYLHGPTPVTSSRYTTSDDVLEAAQLITQEVSDWTPDLSHVLLGTTAIGVLGDLSPGGALMHGTSQQQLHQMIPDDVQKELKQHYNALCELMRHFWSCFPTSSKFLEEKVIRMKSTLERFHTAKLNPLKDKLRQYHYSMDLTGHMQEMMDTAYSKFDTWQARRMSKKS